MKSSRTCIKVLAKSLDSTHIICDPYSINKYRNEQEEEKARQLQEIEDAKIPPGTRLMGEEERVRTLEDL